MINHPSSDPDIIHQEEDASQPLLHSVDRTGCSTGLQRLHHLYHVSQEIILRKLFQISPWKWLTMRMYTPLFTAAKSTASSTTECVWSWLSVSLLFPIKLCCHLFLIIFLALILCYNNDLYGSYHRAAQSLSCRFFLPVDFCDYESCVGYLTKNQPSVDMFTCTIYHKVAMEDAMLSSIEHYFHLNETSLALFQLPSTDAQDSSPNYNCVGDSSHHVPTLNVYYKRSSGHETYELSPDLQNNADLISGLLQPSNRSNIQSMSLKLPLYDTLAFDRYSARYTWRFTIYYTYKSQVSFDIQVKSEVIEICSIDADVSSMALYEDQDDNIEGDNATLPSKQYVIYSASICVIVCCIIYAALLLREAIDNIRLFYYAADVLSERKTVPISPQNSSYLWKCVDCIRRLFSVPNVAASMPQSSENHNNAPKALYGESEERVLLDDWKAMSLKVKMRILDGWRMLSLFATLLSLYVAIVLVQIPAGLYCTIFTQDNQYGDHDIGSTSTSVEYHTDSYPHHNIMLLLGLSLAFHCISVLHYLRYNNRFTTSTLILWGAFFKVQRILFSALPLVIGLLLLGLLLFGNSGQNFGSIPSIFITLYAVMNCDSIYDTFIATASTENAGIIGTIYVTVIFILFNYLMLRLVLAVVESLYFSLRLYSSSRKKRIVFRKKLLANLLDEADLQEDFKLSENEHHSQQKVMGIDKKERKIRVRTHSSEDIQRSLLRMYSLYLKDRQNKQI